LFKDNFFGIDLNIDPIPEIFIQLINVCVVGILIRYYGPLHDEGLLVRNRGGKEILDLMREPEIFIQIINVLMCAILIRYYGPLHDEGLLVRNRGGKEILDLMRD